MAPKFVLPVLILGMVAGIPISTHAAPVRVMGGASTGGAVVLVQTPGMERRQERRADRRDCRQENGLIGQAKRECKQDARQQRNSAPAVNR